MKPTRADSPDPFPTERLAGPASTVASTLLGAVLVVGARSGRIVEVEAYEGANDQASHAACGLTPRNAVMHGAAGHLYVYRIYGMHWCANVVTGNVDDPGAVLIRAIEPLTGLDEMWVDRPKAKHKTDLGSGPGKLCAALGITGDDNESKVASCGASDSGYSRSRIQLLSGSQRAKAVTGPRIGISKATELPWRFAEAGSPFMSRPRLR